ncbi:hypothetical protein V6N11_047026 [Hibiscus sabdariffa]|uniref:DUF4283 domain-containing protein n=1 Tax=Hibiscus sabdariffa TaxID=183260 RepID=A0ABR2NAB8_9ROSI
MLSTLSILLWFFALLLRGISSPGGGFQSSFRPGFGRDAVLSLHDNGIRSAVAVVFFAAPNLSMPRVSSLSLLAISVSFSGRHSQMAQGHGLDNPWITGLSTVVYHLGSFGPTLVHSLATWMLFNGGRLVLAILSFTQWVFQWWRLWSARVSHFPPPPWRPVFFPECLERLPMSSLDSGIRIWVGSGSCLSPIGNPVVLVGRLLVGRLTQFWNHVCDGFWADLQRDHHYLGWRFPFPGRRPLYCRDSFDPMDRPSIRPSVGFLDLLFAWIFLSRAFCFYLGNLCGSYLFSDVHGLCLERLLTAWSMQVIFSPTFLFLDLHPFFGSCRYSFPLLPRATFPLASWRLLHHGLCLYLSRWLPWSIYYFFSTHLHRMASDLIHSMENLQFTEAESGSVVVEPPCEAGDSGLWLVGSVFSSKAVDGDSVCRIFRSVWKSKNIIDILELRPNFFLIKPVMAAAKDMILKRRPWVIHEDLFSIEPYNPDWRAVDFSFTNMVIWVRVYQLPLRAMNGTMGLQLAQKPVAGSRRKQGIEYFDTRGEAAEAVGVAEGQSSVRTEVAGINDKSDEATAAEFVDTLNAGSGPFTVEKGSAAQVPHAAGNATTPRGPVDYPVVPTGAEDATGDVFEGCQATVAPEPDLPADFTDPALPKLAAVLGKSIGGAVPNPALPLFVSTAVGTNPVRAKRTLQGKVFRAKYFRSGSLLDAGLSDHASYAWKGLYSALQDFRDGFLPLSGTGSWHRCGGS